MKENIFYLVEKEELKKILDLPIEGTESSVYSILIDIINSLENQNNIFLFKKNEVIHLSKIRFLIKKEKRNIIKIFLTSSFLTTNGIAELEIVHFELIKIKKRHYFRIVPSIHISILLNNKKIIFPQIFEIKLPEQGSNETLVAQF
jgi:hypothetical protein